MQDRGDKIVNLAREMLRAEFPLQRGDSPDVKKAQVSLRALCLTVFLAAFGSGLLTHAIDEVRRPMNRYERVELDALLFYASRQRAVDESELRREVQERFTFASLDGLSAFEFRRARDFLRGQVR